MIDRRFFLAGAAGMTTAPVAAVAPPLGVFELRQYTLKGGTRAAFTSLFARAFVTPQNLVGSRVIAVFGDLDDPDRFVWVRGFSDMAARKAALEAFYFGPVWNAHREAANAMIVDSDNVLLLKPMTGAVTPATLGGKGVVRVAIYRMRDVDPTAFASFFAARIRPAAEETGARTVAMLCSEAAANTFPRLPVREHDPVFLWVAHFPNAAAERTFDREWSDASGWRDGIADALLPALMQKPEVLRLAPAIALPDT